MRAVSMLAPQPRSARAGSTLNSPNAATDATAIQTALVYSPCTHDTKKTETQRSDSITTKKLHKERVDTHYQVHVKLE